MKKLRKSLINDKNNLGHKEGQRELLRSSKNSFRCPSLGYEQIDNVQQEEIDDIFDFIFEEIIKINQEKNLWKNK